MDVFSAPDMVSRGNFISLMFFVLAIGCLIVYFVLGWTSNVIAQVALTPSHPPFWWQVPS